jgi:hypothetical protein
MLSWAAAPCPPPHPHPTRSGAVGVPPCTTHAACCGGTRGACRREVGGVRTGSTGGGGEADAHLQRRLRHLWGDHLAPAGELGTTHEVDHHLLAYQPPPREPVLVAVRGAMMQWTLPDNRQGRRIDKGEGQAGRGLDSEEHMGGSREGESNLRLAPPSPWLHPTPSRRLTGLAACPHAQPGTPAVWDTTSYREVAPLAMTTSTCSQRG